VQLTARRRQLGVQSLIARRLGLAVLDRSQRLTAQMGDVGVFRANRLVRLGQLGGQALHLGLGVGERGQVGGHRVFLLRRKASVVRVVSAKPNTAPGQM